MEYIEKIDDMGGAVKAIENGFMQREIQESAYRYQKAVESKQKMVVGVNCFQVEEEQPKNLLRVNPAIAELQKERLRA